MSDIKVMVEAAAKKYNGKVNNIGDDIILVTPLTDRSEASLLVQKGKPLSLSHIGVQPDGKVKVGLAIIDEDRLAMYDSLTPIYVLGFGLIDAPTAMMGIVDIDQKLGLDPVYPNPVGAGSTSDEEVVTQINMLAKKDKDLHVLVAGQIKVVALKYHDAPIIIRMNWTQNSISVEYKEYTVANLCAGDMTLSRSFDIASKLIPKLVSVAKNNTRQTVPVSARKGLISKLETCRNKARLIETNVSNQIKQ